MHKESIERIVELLGELEESGGAEILGELVLRAARLQIQRQELDAATQLLTEAGSHLGTTRPADLAGEWLAVARGLSKRGGPAAVADSGAALARAVDLAPARGLPALALYLQHQGRLAEAIERWREAIQNAPTEGTHYLNLARAYDKLGEPEQALASYLALIEAVPSLSSWLMVSERLDGLAPRLPSARPDQTIRIALLGNATVDHLTSFVKVECYRAGLRPEMYQPGFDQYNQQIFDPSSGLYAFAPEVVICAIHASRLFPLLHRSVIDTSVADRHAEIAAGIHSLEELLDGLTQRSSAMVLLHNMVAPQHPALGILDVRDDFGQAAGFAEINLRLAELVRTRYRSVFLVDEDRLQAEIGKARATDPRTWFTARMGWSEQLLPRLAGEHMRFVRAHRGLLRKCVIVDLDNTLWGGVVGEDGLGGIKLGSEAPGNAFVAFQQELERLWRRGVLLAICSKNNAEDAFAVLDQHPDMVLRRSHFAAHRINWQSKAANIREIALELNIGLNSLVFLDDNPVERAQIRAELPEVLTPELPNDAAFYRASLLGLGVFDTLALTDEDRRRNQIYAEQRERLALEEHFGASGSLEGYLAELKMVVELQAADELNLSRIAQLTSKTNQFNMTTRRYSTADAIERLQRGWKIVAARVGDRFGDNGLTGVIIVEPGQETWEIDSLLLSCRVMGRHVETALLAHVASAAQHAGAVRLEGVFVPTAKNAPAEACYREHGFELLSQDANGESRWALDLTGALPTVPAWMTVRAELPAETPAPPREGQLSV